MKKTPLIQNTPMKLLRDQRGQSAVEYLVICTAMVTLFLVSSSQDSVYNMMSHTIHDKYESYAFGISISDPPSKAFDDAVKQDAAKIQKALHELEDVADYIKDHPLPETIQSGDLPSTFDTVIKGFKDLVQDLKNLL